MSIDWSDYVVEKSRFIPDRTLQNAWRVIRSNKKTVIVLSCKKEPQGVSPKGNKFRAAAWALSVVLSIALISLFLLGSKEYIQKLYLDHGGIIKILFAFILSMLYCGVVLPISVLITLPVSKWTPAGNSANRGDG